MRNTVRVETDPTLLEHLRTHEFDGATVAAALFPDGRLMYPGREEVEEMLGAEEPYTLEHEARVIVGLGTAAEAAARFLAREAFQRHQGHDATLDLLWGVQVGLESSRGISPCRLVAALVSVQELAEGSWRDEAAIDAGEVLVAALHAAGFPPSRAALEELFDGAYPASVGLDLVEVAP